MSDYPEHDKLSAVSAKSEAVGSFLEWLQLDRHVKLIVAHSPETDEEGGPVYRDFHGKIVANWKPSGFFTTFQRGNDYKEALRREREEGIAQYLKPDPQGEIDMALRQTTNQLLAEFFEIDLDKLEAEKRQMLEECRKGHDDGD